MADRGVWLVESRLRSHAWRVLENVCPTTNRYWAAAYAKSMRSPALEARAVKYVRAPLPKRKAKKR